MTFPLSRIDRGFFVRIIGSELLCYSFCQLIVGMSELIRCQRFYLEIGASKEDKNIEEKIFLANMIKVIVDRGIMEINEE